jgi:hypothetical protein
MKIVKTVTDPNHPDFGQVTETDLPDIPRPDVPSFKGVRRAKAKALIKAGRYLEAVALLKTIGE